MTNACKDRARNRLRGALIVLRLAPRLLPAARASDQRSRVQRWPRSPAPHSVHSAPWTTVSTDIHVRCTALAGLHRITTGLLLLTATRPLSRARPARSGSCAHDGALRVTGMR